MPEIYFNHHKLLVYAIYLLNQRGISNEMIEKADICIKEYVSRFCDLYGERHMSCNLHLLLYLPVFVRRFGQLWVTSCFPFENFNGILKSLVHKTKYAEIQISSSVSMLFNYSELKRKYLIPVSPISNYCATLDSKSLLKVSKVFQNISIVGKLHKYSHIPPSVLYYPRNIDFDEDKVHTFYRLLMYSTFVDIIHLIIVKEKLSRTL